MAITSVGAKVWHTAMPATNNKCLAQMSKSQGLGEATKKRKSRYMPACSPGIK